MTNSERPTLSQQIPVLAAAIALNVVLAAIVQALKLPIYVDAVGTIVATLMLGLAPGLIVGVVSFLLASVFISPVYVYFVGTQAVIALFVYTAARYLSGFKSLIRVISTGIALGLVAGIVSAPVIVMVFGGATGSGRDLITAVIAGTGERIVNAVFLSGIASEPVDKTIQCLLAFFIIRSLPRFIRGRFSNHVLNRNFPSS